MKKVLAVVLSLALAFPAASLLAQQAPASVKQPVQVAAGGIEGFSLFGMTPVLSIALVVVAAVVIADQVNNDDDPIPAKAAAASGTR